VCRCSTRGDEWARSQKGNNNAYCQDNELSWLSWEHNDEQKDLLRFTKKLIQSGAIIRFSASEVFPGRRIRGRRSGMVMWFNPGGNEMSDEEWRRHSCAASECF